MHLQCKINQQILIWQGTQSSFLLFQIQHCHLPLFKTFFFFLVPLGLCWGSGFLVAAWGLLLLWSMSSKAWSLNSCHLQALKLRHNCLEACGIQCVPCIGKWSGFPAGSVGKESACNTEDLGLIPGFRRSPGEGNGYPLHILAWEIPWTEEPDGLQPIGSKRVRRDWVTGTIS